MEDRTVRDSGTDSRLFAELAQTALHLGAGQTGVIPAREIRVEDRLAEFCRDPGCPGYGGSMSCPPQVSGPAGFRKLVKAYREAMVVKINIPMKILLTDERLEVMGLLHEIVAGVERTAVKRGFTKSKALAGGSCKMIFCADHPSCRVLKQGGECRHPDQARPSMSGFGINVAELMRSAGLPYNRVGGKTTRGANSQGSIVGLVLIG